MYVASCQIQPRVTTSLGVSPKYPISSGMNVVTRNAPTFRMMIHLTANVIGPGPKE